MFLDLKNRHSQIVGMVFTVLFLLALSVRTYSWWTKGFDDPVHHPNTILSGNSLAPDQYRVLYPLLWKTVSLVLGEQDGDKGLLFVSILFCYVVLYEAFVSGGLSGLSACLFLLAFYGTTHSWYHYFYRDTFLEVALVVLAYRIQAAMQEGRNWGNRLALLSVAGIMNRESWVFVLTGVVCGFMGKAGGVSSLFRAPEAVVLRKGLVKITTASVLAFVSVRLLYGFKPYFTSFWTLDENAYNLLFWKDVSGFIGHGLWSAGAGILFLYVWSVLRGNRTGLLFIAGYVVPLLAASFLFGRCGETRIFFPAFAVILCSLASYVTKPFVLTNDSGVK